MKDESRRPDEDPPRSDGRKRYSKPSLHAYGAIRAITENIANTFMMDGSGVAGMTKTG